MVDASLDAIVHGLLLAWPIWAGAGVIILISVATKLYRHRRFASSGIKRIDAFTGTEFEAYLAQMFRRLGYEVSRTRTAGDFGGDLVVRCGDERTVVQAKRYSKAVGVRAVQEVVAAKANYDCASAMVVTNSYFTKQAEHLAEKNAVVLWNRDELVEQLIRARSRRARHAIRRAA